MSDLDVKTSHAAIFSLVRRVSRAFVFLFFFECHTCFDRNL